MIECPNTGETADDYGSYLKTEHWSNIRRIYNESGRCKEGCFCCGVQLKSYDVHHVSYKNLGSECWDDLTHLCRECHNNCHRFVKRGMCDVHEAHLCVQVWEDLKAQTMLKAVAIVRGSIGKIEE